MWKIVCGEAYGNVHEIAGSYLGVGTGCSEVIVIFYLVRKIPGYFASRQATTTTTSLPIFCLLGMISCLRREVDEYRPLLGHYAASSGDS
jgi:hypothetical protein